VKDNNQPEEGTGPGYRKRPGDIILRLHRPFRLHRSLGVMGLFSTAYGNVGSSIYYALGVVAMSALGLTPLVLIAASVLFLFTGLTYAEGASALPEAGGSGAFARRAFNDGVSFIASWALMLDYIVTIAISAFTAANYLGYFFPMFRDWPVNSIAGIGLVIGLIFINIRGIKESSRMNTFLVFVDIATEVSVAVIGVVLLVNFPRLIHNVHWGVAPTMGHLLFGISISMVAFTGIETVANLGGETKNPAKSMPRAVIMVFITVLILYALLSMTALSAYPVHQVEGGRWVTDLTQKYLQDPILGIVYAMPANIQSIMGFWVAILAITILTIATNAGIIGASRLAYFMGQRKQLPSTISQISPNRVPRNAIIIFPLIACLAIAIGRVTFLADLYAFGAMLAYTLAHLSIIGLRIKEPHLPRPFKIPLNIRIREREIPLTAIIGGLGTAVTWFIVLYTHEIGRWAGLLWIIIGVVIYWLYHRRKRRLNAPPTYPSKFR
jgi:basic amino acid/polyamine antiporter, APA family